MLVAVVIPCFNVAPYVERAIRSACEQTHPEVEVILVDDGSSDGTRAIIERVAAECSSSRPMRIMLREHGGACAARNAGLGVTSAPYIQFLDADDMLLPGKIAGQVRLVQANGDVGVIAGGYRNRWDDDRTLDVHPVGDAWTALVRGSAGTTSANLWSREAVLAAGGWDERLASSQDHELIFRMLRNGSDYAIDERVETIILKRSSLSISRTDPLGNWERYVQLRSAIRNHVVGRHLHHQEGLVAEVDRLMFGAIRIIARNDRARAERLLLTHLPTYVPTPGAGISKAYAIVHRLTGFVGAERAAAAWNILRPTHR
ncbi:MAG: glycosyltransferase family 2 protein [Flavobacteriales bacterium]|nr:glycosyltransferase family 2 protein [Flavobacteriales bacterium]